MRVASRRLTLALLVALALLGASGCATSKAKKAIVLPTPSKGNVTVALDFTAYKTSQPIGVTVINGSKSAFYATTDETDCTFLQLQQLDAKNNQWQRVGPCGSPNDVATYQLPAGVKEPLTLPPGIPGDNKYLNSWPSGEYRIALLYTDAATGGHSFYAFSPGFLIR